jgi:transposase-like protein
MSEFAQVGDFCPKRGCSDYGELQKGNIIKFGKTKAGRQRYLCHSCKGTFTETKGTIFFRKRTPDQEIMESLALIAEGSRVSSVARVKGHKEDTIVAWIRDAAQHAQAIEAELLKDYRIERGQLDAMWSYVGNKGEKRATQKQNTAVSSGVRQ